MDTDLFDRAALVLRDAPERTLTLARLHAVLASDDPATPAADRLAARLATDRRFILVRGPDPLAIVSLACDGATRERYLSALRDAAGDVVRVTLADLPDRDLDVHPIALVERSLIQLDATRDAPGMAYRIAEARAEYGALVRSLPFQLDRR